MKFYGTLFTELQHRNPPPPPPTLRTGQGSSLNTRRVALGTAQPPVRADSEHYYYASVISLHDSCFPSLSSYLCFFQRCRLIPLALAPLWFSLNALPSPNDELQHDTPVKCGLRCLLSVAFPDSTQVYAHLFHKAASVQACIVTVSPLYHH